MPAIVAAFRRIGGIDRRTLLSALTWGKAPSLRITPLAGAFGQFTPDVHSSEICVNTALVEEFEAGKGRRVVAAGFAFLLCVTLLHELTHWADDQDGVDRPGEEGEEFERAMYGRVIN